MSSLAFILSRQNRRSSQGVNRAERRANTVREFPVSLAGQALADGWHVRRVVTVDGETETVTLLITPGLRVLIGGMSTVEPQAHSVVMSEEHQTSGVWVIKQFSLPLNAWVEGVQVIPASELTEDDWEDDYIEISEQGEVDYNLWPDTLRRQRRVLARVNPDGTVEQFAHGSIYACSRGENLGDDVPEDEADDADAEADGRCDQNRHPGRVDQDDDDHPGLTDPVDDDEHPGGGNRDETDDDHPAAGDCYTSR